MKKRILIIAVIGIAILSCLLSSCTSNEMAKEYGGSTSVALPQGQKLITATWKDNDLWYLTRSMKEGDVAESYQFKEESSYGIWNGTVTIVESK